MWRLLLSGIGRGAYNMALDEALLDVCVAAVECGEMPAPTLRFYGWSPGCVSLGYTQDARRVLNFDALAAAGYEWLRRPTGGRAVLHTAEVTYSIVAPIADKQVGGSVLDAYRAISNALVAGLDALGVAAHLAPVHARAALRDAGAVCFDAPSAYEVVVGDANSSRKLIGSAQVRRGGCLLQQGSILLDVDADEIYRYVTPPARQDPAEAASHLAARLTAINPERAAAGLPPVPFIPAALTLVAAFAHHFDTTLVGAVPTAAEAARAAELERIKYADDAWNFARQRPIIARH